MANLKIVATMGSRIFEDDGSWTPAGAEDASISDWVIGDQFLLAAIVWGGGGCNKITDAATLSLWFRKDGGSWTAVGASTEISYTTSTSITDNANITTNRITGNIPTAQCSGSATTDGVQEEGSNTFTSFSIGTAESWTEVWIALDTTNATAGSTYEFALYNNTETQYLYYNDLGAGNEALLTDLTMASATPITLSANAACTTTTSGIDISITDKLSAAASCTTTTSAPVLSITTKLSANAACTTTTSAIDLDTTAVKLIAANAACTTTTSGIALSITDKLSAAASCTTTTSAPVLSITIKLSASAACTTTTSAIDFAITNNLAANATCTTATNNTVVLGITNTLAAVTAVVTQTGLIDLTITDQLSCSCSVATSSSSINLTRTLKLFIGPLVNGDAEDATYADSSSHALIGWTNVGSHDATNKITIE